MLSHPRKNPLTPVAHSIHSVDADGRVHLLWHNAEAFPGLAIAGDVLCNLARVALRQPDQSLVTIRAWASRGPQLRPTVHVLSKRHRWSGAGNAPVQAIEDVLRQLEAITERFAGVVAPGLALRCSSERIQHLAEQLKNPRARPLTEGAGALSEGAEWG